MCKWWVEIISEYLTQRKVHKIVIWIEYYIKRVQ